MRWMRQLLIIKVAVFFLYTRRKIVNNLLL